MSLSRRNQPRGQPGNAGQWAHKPVPTQPLVGAKPVRSASDCYEDRWLTEFAHMGALRSAVHLRLGGQAAQAAVDWFEDVCEDTCTCAETGWRRCPSCHDPSDNHTLRDLTKTIVRNATGFDHPGVLDDIASEACWDSMRLWDAENAWDVFQLFHATQEDCPEHDHYISEYGIYEIIGLNSEQTRRAEQIVRPRGDEARRQMPWLSKVDEVCYQIEDICWDNACEAARERNAELFYRS